MHVYLPHQRIQNVSVKNFVEITKTYPGRLYFLNYQGTSKDKQAMKKSRTNSNIIGNYRLSVEAVIKCKIKHLVPGLLISLASENLQNCELLKQYEIHGSKDFIALVP